MKSSLYRNSIYLMASSVVTALFGFIFWILCARLFSTQTVGVATTIVSTAGFISEFSLLGLKNSLIRYLPQSSTKNTKMNTALNVVFLITLFLSLAFIIATPLLSDQLTFLRGNLIYLILFTVFLVSLSLNQIQEGIFIAFRSTSFVFVKNIFWGILKLVLPFVLLAYGSFGVFSAFSIGSLVSLIFGFYILKTKFNFRQSFQIDKLTLRQVGRFSFGDYVGIFFAQVPYFILPLVIINRLGADEAAFYYIAMQIAAVLFIIPGAVNQSLFAEGSQNEDGTKSHLINSLKFTSMLLIPLVILIMLFGGFILQIFGSYYSQNALSFLRLMALDGVFVGINQVGSALLHVQQRVGLYVRFNMLSAVVIVILSYVLLKYGLYGIGLSFLLGYGAASVAYLFVIKESLR